MLIVCAGRSRSGSTLLYNLVRVTLCESVGKDKVYACSHRYYNSRVKKPYHVIKIHEYDPRFARKTRCVFSCFRDEEAQRKSILKFRKIVKKQDLTQEELDKFIQHDKERFNRWKKHRKFVEAFNFNDLVNNPDYVINKICKSLKLKAVDSNRILEIINCLPLPDKKFDKETCLTPSHFTSKEFQR
jgi:hypothetical protein